MCVHIYVKVIDLFFHKIRAFVLRPLKDHKQHDRSVPSISISSLASRAAHNCLQEYTHNRQNTYHRNVRGRDRTLHLDPAILPVNRQIYNEASWILY